MGLLSKVKPKFVPEDLNSDMIKQIFHGCIATESTSNTYPIRLKEKDASDIITFDWDLIKKNKRAIRYILGQLKVVHNHKFSITLSELNLKYDDTPIFEETDKVTPIQLVALGIVTTAFSHLQDDNTVNVLTTTKTLSPYDPAFKAWWEEHKSEWED